MREIFGFVIGITILGLFFWILEWIWPEDRTQPKWRSDSFTDLIYWFFSAFITKFLANIVLLIAIVITAHFIPRLSTTVISSQPLWLQAIELLLLGDLLGYWSHRLFHSLPALWRIHAVHHSPEKLDWLAAARVHPLNDVISKLSVVVPLYLLGFAGGALTAYVPFLVIYPIFLHANVSWSFGPLRYIIASPAYHRWHHSADPEALDKNFSGLFPLVDVIFGTIYFPKNSHPRRYGLYGEKMPRGFLNQMTYPFH